ncbi:MAG: phytanoyl-CoA dioxygenase family protein [bacterium]|jgi:hypothetical protein
MISHPSLNAEGVPPVVLTEEQKYLFDTRGWLLMPGVLSEDECAEMRDFSYRLQRDRESVPPEHRSSIGGSLERLIDHPAIVGFMNTFVAHGAVASEYGYGFRLEGSFLTIRKEGDDNYSPHGGGGMFNSPGNSHQYNAYPGHVNAALTRAVWELNPVRKRSGGTLFLTGSHKAAFPFPASIRDDRDSVWWDDYECPAGSLLFFTEAITHTGDRWTNPDWDRVAVFNCYNTVNAKWHKWEPNADHLAQMPPLRRSLFRGVYCEDNDVKAPAG